MLLETCSAIASGDAILRQGAVTLVIRSRVEVHASVENLNLASRFCRQGQSAAETSVTRSLDRQEGKFEGQQRRAAETSACHREAVTGNGHSRLGAISVLC